MALNLQHFEFFLAIVREESFSGAATALYTSQPHVSNKIKELEKHYGVVFFDRTGSKVTLTEAGEALRGQVETLFGCLEDIDSLMQEFRGLHRGELAIAATAGGGSHVLPGYIAEFRDQYPNITVRVRLGNTSSVEEWIHDGVVEVGVCPRQPSAKSLSAEAIFEDPLIAICPSDFPLDDSVTLEEFIEQPFVLREPGSSTREKMEELVASLNRTLKVVAEFQGTTAVNEAVAAGIGVSLIPLHSAHRWLEIGRVRRLTVRDLDVRHVHYAIYRKRRYLSPPASAFIEFLTSR